MKVNLILLPILIFSSLASAGKEGGSSGAYVCRDAQKKITKMELADLWEARETLGQQIAYDDITSVEDQVTNAIARLRRFNPRVGPLISAIKLKQVPAGADVSWAPPDDIRSKFTKEGCPLEGLMYFNDLANRLIINPELYPAQKRKTEIAAGLFHEKVYKYLRSVGATDSNQTRYIVGCIFSKDPAGCFDIAPPEFNFSRDEVWHCDIPASSSKEAAVYPESELGAFSFYIAMEKPFGTQVKDTGYVQYAFTSFAGEDLRQETIATYGYMYTRTEKEKGSKPFTHLSLEFSSGRFHVNIGGNLPIQEPLTNRLTNIYFKVMSFKPLVIERWDEPNNKATCTPVTENPKPMEIK